MITNREAIIRRRSRQRELVLEAVRKCNHPSAREIFESLTSDKHRISFGTVYRNLQILQEEGVVIQVQSALSSLHYDIRTDKHYHLHCKKCDNVFDISIPYDNELDKRAQSLSGYTVDFHTASFEGLCDECAAILKL
ncbi:MAG: transcriptional repressor [Treponemataceae bacterium]|nr:MAG: transcriptional repressor [Treponemataceae bacterium]